MFEESGGLTGLETLEYANNEPLREQADRILDTYFYKEEADGAVLPLSANPSVLMAIFPIMIVLCWIQSHVGISGNEKRTWQRSLPSLCKVKLKVKVHTLDIAPLRTESLPQKRSGMARVLKGFHSFTCTPTRSSTIGMSHTYLCLPSRSWYLFTNPRGIEG